MKNNLFYIFGLLLLTSSLFLTGCDDELEIGPTVTVTNVSPAAAYGGDAVTLQGSNLNTVNAIFIGDKHADEVQSMSESSITFIVPRNAVPGPSIITLAMANNYRVTVDFEVLQRPIPEIHAISPTAAASGEEVTIAGMNLNVLTSVKVGGVAASTVSATNNLLVITVPDGLPINSPAEIELATQEVTEVSTSIFYVGDNKVANSDLEDGSGDDFTDWTKLNGGDQMTEVTGADAYFGRSLRIVGAAANPWNTQLASLPTPLNFGSEYTILLWARAEAAGAQMRVSVSQFDGNGADYFYGETVDIPTEWTQLSWTFEVTNDLETHRVVLDMGMTDVPFLIDNVILIETGAAGPPIPQNLLANSGFENGLDSWLLLNGSVEPTTEEVHCGSQAIKVTGAGGNPWDTQMAADVVPLVQGNEYEVKLWAKAAEDGAVMRVSASRYNGGNGDDYFYGADVALTTEWAEYSWIFTVGKDIPDGHHLVLDMGASDKVFYVDDVSLAEYVEVIPINILDNGDFEDGMTSWELLNGSVEPTAEEVASGSQALKVTGAGGNPWDTQMAAAAVPLVLGNRYAVKLMAKAAEDGAVMRISASRYNGGNGDDYFYGADANLTTEWAEYTWEFTVGKDIPDGHHIVLDMGASDKIFYIDNVILYEVPEFVCP
ncbi:carbohydrate binding domain-containing protein [Flavilitoribacter nigricans]|uniref:CBM-cenC domain-containing protein n=1 Tax=Flavilitoribacter nigricans (strain ATCC 23147 / DSM 23189 / NBRC 102662 / NCIMB 1420 / SS-2) TaxID=1122177 RepID=A0A2D0MZM9_FLAN2|nr:carbohydrate binding domain-containing protein [Flavilitoribacter nigricans]PHN01630.1 hypothetical protein CRP01_36025 [Flavilitoribacter nigricans DSM 23189 = NBRC 102662]